MHQLMEDDPEADAATPQGDRLTLAGPANAAGATISGNEVDVVVLRGSRYKPKGINS